MALPLEHHHVILGKFRVGKKDLHRQLTKATPLYKKVRLETRRTTNLLDTEIRELKNTTSLRLQEQLQCFHPPDISFWVDVKRAEKDSKLDELKQANPQLRFANVEGVVVTFVEDHYYFYLRKDVKEANKKKDVKEANKRSSASGNPTRGPTTGPTPAPTTGPTQIPTTGPTPAPIPGPTPAPLPGPTKWFQIGSVASSEGLKAAVDEVCNRWVEEGPNNQVTRKTSLVKTFKSVFNYYQVLLEGNNAFKDSPVLQELNGAILVLVANTLGNSMIEWNEFYASVCLTVEDDVEIDGNEPSPRREGRTWLQIDSENGCLNKMQLLNFTPIRGNESWIDIAPTPAQNLSSSGNSRTGSEEDESRLSTVTGSLSTAITRIEELEAQVVRQTRANTDLHRELETLQECLEAAHASEQCIVDLQAENDTLRESVRTMTENMNRMEIMSGTIIAAPTIMAATGVDHVRMSAASWKGEKEINTKRERDSPFGQSVKESVKKLKAVPTEPKEIAAELHDSAKKPCFLPVFIRHLNAKQIDTATRVQGDPDNNSMYEGSVISFEGSSNPSRCIEELEQWMEQHQQAAAGPPSLATVPPQTRPTKDNVASNSDSVAGSSAACHRRSCEYCHVALEVPRRETMELMDEAIEIALGMSRRERRPQPAMTDCEIALGERSKMVFSMEDVRNIVRVFRQLEEAPRSSLSFWNIRHNLLANTSESSTTNTPNQQWGPKKTYIVCVCCFLLLALVSLAVAFVTSWYAIIWILSSLAILIAGTSLPFELHRSFLSSHSHPFFSYVLAAMGVVILRKH